MNLKYYTWAFKGELSAEICDSIIKIGLSRKKEQAIVQETNRNRSDSVRDLEKDPLQPEEEKKLLQSLQQHHTRQTLKTSTYLILEKMS